MSKAITVLFTNVLEYKSGSAALTKQYMNDHPGRYPVYSAKTIGETKVGEIDSYMFDIEGLQLTTNGANAGTWLYREKHKFSLNGDARLYYPKDEFKNVVDVQYLFYALQFAFKSKGFDWNTKATVNNTQNIKISIPVLPDGTYDLETQKKLARQYQEIESKKQILLGKAEELKKYKILIEKDKTQKCTPIKFNDIFKLSRGKIISKPYILEHSGDYPVYSTQQGVYGYIDSYMKDGQFLLWNTDGLAGYIKKTDGKFSFTNIVGIMIPTGKIDMTNISLDYLKWYLEPIFRQNRKGRMGINGKNEYTKLNSTMITQLDISIPIPINEDGSFNLEKQKELAQKYASIETLKEEVCNRIKALTNIVVC